MDQVISLRTAIDIFGEWREVRAWITLLSLVCTAENGRKTT